MLTLDALMAQRQVPNHFSDHNAVLKYVRDHQEHEGQGTKELSLEWDHQGIEMIPVVLKPPGGGPDYSYSDTESFQWCAKWMLCNLNDKDLAQVVSGPQGRGRGIVKAVLSKVDNASSDGGITITNVSMQKDMEKPHGST